MIQSSWSITSGGKKLYLGALTLLSTIDQEIHEKRSLRRKCAKQHSHCMIQAVTPLFNMVCSKRVRFCIIRVP